MIVDLYFPYEVMKKFECVLGQLCVPEYVPSQKTNCFSNSFFFFPPFTTKLFRMVHLEWEGYLVIHTCLRLSKYIQHPASSQEVAGKTCCTLFREE